MRENKANQMVMSKTPDGRILMTACGQLREAKKATETDEQFAQIFRASSDAVATEIVPQTEDAFSDFVSRHGGEPLYPTLAAYPNPSRDR